MNARWIALLAATALAAGLGAWAGEETGPFAEETPAGHWDQYPAREVERPALPPKGGAVISAAFSSIASQVLFDDGGRPQDAKDSYNLLAITFELAYGVASWWEISAGFPYLAGDVYGVSGGGAGDIFTGTRFALFSRPELDLSLGINISLPTGDSSFHYETSGNKLVLQNFRTGSPGINYYPRLEARINRGPWSARVSGQGVFTSPGEVDFHLAGPAAMGFAWLDGDGKEEVDPGDGYIVSAGLLYQITDRWAAGAAGQYETISETQIAGRGLGDERALVKVQPQVVYQAAQEFEVWLAPWWAAAGRNAPAGFGIDITVTSRF